MFLLQCFLFCYIYPRSFHVIHSHSLCLPQFIHYMCHILNPIVVSVINFHALWRKDPFCVLVNFISLAACRVCLQILPPYTLPMKEWFGAGTSFHLVSRLTILNSKSLHLKRAWRGEGFTVNLLFKQDISEEMYLWCLCYIWELLSVEENKFLLNVRLCF